MSDTKKPRESISFNFSKKKANKVVKSAVTITNENENDDDQDFVTSVEGKDIKSIKPKQEKKVLVIPLITNNRWRTAVKPEDLDTAPTLSAKETKQPELIEGSDKIETEAARELVEEAKKQQKEWTDRDGKKPMGDFAIPLLMQNKVPDGFETDDRLNVELRPDQATEADYESVPIEQFGFAMLRGMGWKEDDPENEKRAKPLEAVARPKGLGLGADRSMVQQVKDADRGKGKVGTGDESESLVMKPGACCMVVAGKHKDLYAMVESLDEDNSRAFIKLAVGSQTVTINQMVLKLVPRKEYDRYSKYLNKSKVDKFKEKEENGHADSDSHDEHSHSKHKKKSRHRNRSKSPEKGKSKKRQSRSRSLERTKEASLRHKRRSRSSSRDRQNKISRTERSRSRSRDRYNKMSRTERSRSRSCERHNKASGRGNRSRSRERDSSKRDSKSHRQHNLKTTDEKSSSANRSDSVGTVSSSRPDVGPVWLRPNLRVRIVDEKYKKGKFFKTKVVVEDVVGRDVCICRTESGDILENVTQAMVETVIPKSEPAHVMLVSGEYKGQIGVILQKDKVRCVAMIQLLSDRDVVLPLEYDNICEYTGDINMEYDY